MDSYIFFKMMLLAGITGILIGGVLALVSFIGAENFCEYNGYEEADGEVYLREGEYVDCCRMELAEDGDGYEKKCRSFMYGGDD